MRLFHVKDILHQGLSEPDFYEFYKLKKNVGRADVSYQYRKNVICYKRIGYNIDIMRKSACFMVNPITVNNIAVSLIACRWAGRQTH